MTNTNALETSKIRFLDELSAFHVKDITRLKPGEKIIFGHVPNLDREDYFRFRDHKVYPQMETVEVVAVEWASFNELHSSLTNLTDDEWAPEKKLVIRYRSERGHEGYRHASDASIVAYNPETNFFNDTNFVVIPQELEDAGLVLIPEVTAVYRKAADLYNSTVVERDYDY